MARQRELQTRTRLNNKGKKSGIKRQPWGSRQEGDIRHAQPHFWGSHEEITGSASLLPWGHSSEQDNKINDRESNSSYHQREKKNTHKVPFWFCKPTISHCMWVIVETYPTIIKLTIDQWMTPGQSCNSKTVAKGMFPLEVHVLRV